jgi:hypothetical protein
MNASTNPSGITAFKSLESCADSGIGVPFAATSKAWFWSKLGPGQKDRVQLDSDCGRYLDSESGCSQCGLKVDNIEDFQCREFVADQTRIRA